MERKKAKMADWWEECFLSGGIGKGRDMAAMSEERDEMWLLCPREGIGKGKERDMAAMSEGRDEMWLLCPTVVKAIGWVGDEW